MLRAIVHDAEVSASPAGLYALRRHEIDVTAIGRNRWAPGLHSPQRLRGRPWTLADGARRAIDHRRPT